MRLLSVDDKAMPRKVLAQEANALHGEHMEQRSPSAAPKAALSGM